MALVLFLANLTAGVCVGTLVWHWLAVALDGSAATQTLLTHLDLNVFIDLVVHHGESLRMLLATTAMVTLAFVPVGAWCGGAVAVSVTADTDLLALGSITVLANGDVDLAEVHDAMRVSRIESSTGSVTLTVPDTVGTTDDLVLLDAGAITAAATVEVRVGDDEYG